VIFFELGSARIDPDSALQSGVVWLLQSWRDGGLPAIHLSGHADRLGSEGANLTLSRRRAEAVRDYFVANGVPRDKISIEWLGEARPMIDTADDVAEPQNRFVLAVPENWGRPPR
jgi:outer membrane protein OmpA-like peptidoglycan-associated protein